MEATNLKAQGEAVVTHTPKRSKGPPTLRERKSSPGRTMRSREEARRNLILAEQTKQCEANRQPDRQQANRCLLSPKNLGVNQSLVSLLTSRRG